MNYYWVGNTANWDGTAGSKWATSSGGAGGAGPPTSSDAVFFDANSYGGCTIVSGAAAASIDCTGFNGTLAGSQAMTLSGNAFRLSPGMTFSYSGALTFAPSGTMEVQTFGNYLSSLTVNGAGTVQLQDGLSLTETLSGGFYTKGILTLLNGTFDANGNDVTIAQFYAGLSSNTNARALLMGSGTWTVTGQDHANECFQVECSTNFVLNAGTSTLRFTPHGTLAGCTLDFGLIGTGAAGTFNDLWMNSGTPYILAVRATKPITFNDIKVDPTGELVLFTSTTCNVSTLTAVGTTAASVYLVGETGSSLNAATSQLQISWATLQNFVVTGALGTALDSVDQGGNTGWTFLESLGFGAHFGGSARLDNYAVSASDSSLLSGSFWFRVAAQTSTAVLLDVINTTPVDLVEILFDGSGNMTIECVDVAGSHTLTFSVAGVQDGNFHHCLFSVDNNHAAGSKIWKVIIDDVPSSSSVAGDVGGAFSTGYSGSLATVGSYHTFGVDTLTADVIDLWIAPGQSLLTSGDITVATRRKFITADLQPVSLGPDGSTPTGTAPALFFSGPGNVFASNRGTGGSFDQNGYLGTVEMPVIYDVAAPESLTLSDPAVGGIVLSGVAADSLSLTDDADGDVKQGGTSAETLAFADVTASSLGFSTSASDILAIYDLGTGTATLATAAAETLTMSDASAGGAIFPAASAETMNPSDQAAGAANMLAPASDALVLTAASSESAALIAAGAEALALADSAPATAGWATRAAETVSLADATRSSIVFALDPEEIFSLADAAAEAGMVSVDAEETLILSDASTVSADVEYLLETLTMVDAAAAAYAGSFSASSGTSSPFGAKSRTGAVGTVTAGSRSVQ